MRHLDEQLNTDAVAGDREALEIQRAGERLSESVEVLMGYGVCPGCICTEVEHVLDHHGWVIEAGSRRAS